VAAGASYVAFGAFFPPAARSPCDVAIAWTCWRDSAALGVPRVAIGGITPDNAPSLVAAGADLVA
jgi:thiamine-phosphate pyrophosphorylase